MGKKLYLAKYKSLRFTIQRVSPSMVNKRYFNWFNDKTTKKYIEFSPKNISELKENVILNLKKKDVLFFGIFFQKKHIGNIKFEKIDLLKTSKSDEIGLKIEISFSPFENCLSIFE